MTTTPNNKHQDDLKTALCTHVDMRPTTCRAIKISVINDRELYAYNLNSFIECY